MNKITNPHDRFFRSAMTDIRVARDFFNFHLPDFIKKAIDWDSLTLCSSSYIDKTLKLTASDVLYQVKLLDQTAYIYLLAEHQSQPNKLMPFRIWQYILSIQADHLKKTQSDKLPLVYPLVFYHGKSAYPYSTDFRDLIGAPDALIEQVLYKPFQLIDSNNISDETLKQLQWAGVMEFMMKHIFARDYLPYIKQLFQQLRYLEKADGSDYIISMLNYIVSVGQTADPKHLIATLQAELPTNTEEKFMATVADWLIAQGKIKGLEEGIQEGKLKGLQLGKLEGLQQGKLRGKKESLQLVAKRLLEKGSDLQFIAEVTNLSIEEIKRLSPKTIIQE